MVSPPFPTLLDIAMKRALLLLAATALVWIAASLLTPARRAVAADNTTAAQVAALRAHFAQVEREMLARDVSALTPAQRAARARNLQVLREYAAAGVFPHNHHLALRAPYFVDDHGTLCAMAYLIARSGHEDLVRKVAATRNNARVRDLADDPELVAWLEENGITAHEAGRIQPFYGEPPQDESDEFGFAYIAPSVVLGMANTALIVFNARPARSPLSPRWRGGLGLAAGGFGIALGASGLHEESVDDLAKVNLALGTLSAALGAHALLTGQETAAQTTLRLSPRRTLTLQGTPVVGREGAGLHFNVRF